MNRRYKVTGVAAWFCLAIGLCGCRDREPVEAYPYVMRSGDVVLLPTSVSLRDPRILEGTAQVVAIEDRPVLPTDSSATPPSGEGAAAAPADGGMAAIQAMIEEYNALAREKKTDELIGFVHPKLQPLAEAMLPLNKAFQDLVAAIESKTPGGSAALGPIASQMNSMSQEISVTNITMTGETTATGTMSVAGLPMSVPVNFEKVENDWYLAAGNVPANLDAAQVKPQIDGVVQELQTITNGIKDGSIDQQQATMRIMTTFMKLGSIFMAGNPPSGQPATPDAPAAEATPAPSPPTGG